MPETTKIGETLKKFTGATRMSEETISEVPEPPPTVTTDAASAAPTNVASVSNYEFDDADMESIKNNRIDTNLREKLMNIFSGKKQPSQKDLLIDRLSQRLDKLEAERSSKPKDTKKTKHVSQLKVKLPSFEARKEEDPYNPFAEPVPVNKFPLHTFGEICGNKKINNTFPNYKFTGNVRDKFGVSVEEFLKAMNEGQQECLLSEDDFKRVLLRKCGGEAHGMVNRWIDLKFTVDDIYAGLLKNYGRGPEPESSHRFILTYRPPRNLPYDKILQEIEEAGRNASLLCHTEIDQTNMYNTVCIMALRNCLPFNGTRYVEEKIAEHRGEHGTEPSFQELTAALKNYSVAIDKELRNPPPDYEFGPQRAFLEFPTEGTSQYGKLPRGQQTRGRYTNSRINQIQSGDHYEPHINAVGSPYGNPYNSGKQMGAPHNSSRVTGGKRYCPMCDRNNHSPHDKCTAIRDARGKMVEGALSSAPCNNCRGKLQLDLYHNEKYCPIRDEMMRLYDTGDVIPVHHFARYYYGQKNGGRRNGNNRPANSHQSNYNTGNFAMIGGNYDRPRGNYGTNHGNNGNHGNYGNNNGNYSQRQNGSRNQHLSNNQNNHNNNYNRNERVNQNNNRNNNNRNNNSKNDNNNRNSGNRNNKFKNGSR